MGYDFAEVKQFEYSTVIFGAVSDTPLHALKSETTINELILELELKLRTCNYSDEYGKLIEVKIKELKSMLLEPTGVTQTDIITEPSLDTHEKQKNDLHKFNLRKMFVLKTQKELSEMTPEQLDAYAVEKTSF